MELIVCPDGCALYEMAEEYAKSCKFTITNTLLFASFIISLFASL